MDKLEAETAKKKKGETTDPVMLEYLEKYEEISQMEKNRDRNEYRTCQICKDASNLTKSRNQKIQNPFIFQKDTSTTKGLVLL